MNSKWVLVFGFSASAWLPLGATAQSSPPQWQIEDRLTTPPSFEVAPTAEALPQWQAVPEPSGDRPWQPATPEELAQPILPPMAEQAPTPVIAEAPQYRIPLPYCLGFAVGLGKLSRSAIAICSSMV
ncbi:hypothetical protein [uncultured Thermosynechococcus sp.]|uniref:hypothetical protein n=1 Tax=uncultured Thermosynechococcus sp. TaxID=436945 RepID=UPI00262A6040|nr:hypothetical protein [uncultured Thermosynechococcus sp.]